MKFLQRFFSDGYTTDPWQDQQPPPDPWTFSNTLLGVLVLIGATVAFLSVWFGIGAVFHFIAGLLGWHVI